MRVFISFATRDHQVATQIGNLLRDNGAIPFTLNLKISLGGDLFHRIEAALQHPNHIIVVLSPSYLRDSWLKKELLALVTRELTTDTHGLIIPIVASTCQIPPDNPLRNLKNFEERVLQLDNQTFVAKTSDLLARLTATRRVFVVMSFNNSTLNTAYANVMKKVIVESGYVPIRIDEMKFSGGITDQILTEIEQSEIVLAEMSGEKANCYYEVGYAHALRKEMILTNFKASNIAFNLRNLPFIEWSTEEELERKLRKRFQEIWTPKTNVAQVK